MSMRRPALPMITIGVAWILAGGLPNTTSACTVFTASNNGVVLFGNNEDWKDPHSRIWFFPPEDGKYGRVYFGWERYGVPEGAVNDQGLAFDALATPSLPVKESAGKEVYSGNLVEKVMQECETVAEVLDIFGQYNLSRYTKAQLFFADRTGDAAIIEGDVIHRKKGGFLAATNFYLSQTAPGVYPCLRYRIATDMLSQPGELSVDLFRRILSAVHMEGQTPTLYSTIYDLRKGLIYLYHYHDFQHVVVFDIRSELAKGWHAVEIASLFPKKYASETFTSEMKEPISIALRQELSEKGVVEAIKKYRFLREFEEGQYDFSSYVLNVIGHELLWQGRTNDAVEWFKLGVMEHPEWSYAHGSLGEAHQANGQLGLARESYRKALELKPDNRFAAERLKQLGGP